MTLVIVKGSKKSFKKVKSSKKSKKKVKKVKKSKKSLAQTFTKIKFSIKKLIKIIIYTYNLYI